MRKIAFVWDNFGPMHVDRCEAAANRFPPASVFGIEMFSVSHDYDWENPESRNFKKITVFNESPSQVGFLREAAGVFSACRKSGAKYIFLCHYDRLGILLVAFLLRLFGCRVFAMGCSKFDDYERRLNREFLKQFFLLPYQGAISSGKRSRDYMRFLGIPANRIAVEYNTLSTDRIRQLAAAPPAPDGVPHDQRHFLIVARLLPKKNLFMALEAYAAYRQMTSFPRHLHLCGSGPLEAELRERAETLGIGADVKFEGFLQTGDIARLLGKSLALLLPSIEEQFGNVVIEAQAMGLPVILSDNCGARDILVRSGVNGFVIEPDNPQGMAYFMDILGRDEQTWKRMAQASRTSAEGADTARFADAVAELTGL